jgi:hypothetical protein
MISVTNLTILTILHGKELVWICLGSCSTDVLVNALVLFWLTRPRHGSDEQSTGVAAGVQGRIRSDQGKSAGGFNPSHLRPTSGPVASSFNGKAHQTANDGAKKERPISIKVDLEGGDGGEQYAYYSEVYDGSSQHLRSGQLGSPILASPTLTSSAGGKSNGSPTQFTYPPLSSPPLSPPPLSYQRRRHRHSVGFYQDKDKKTTGNVDRHSFLEFGGQSPNAKTMGILERIGLRSSSAKDDLARYAGLRSVGGVGMKKKKNENSDDGENMQVRITITTHLETEEEDLRTDAEGTAKSGGNQ